MAGEAKLFVREDERWVERAEGAGLAEALSRERATTVVEWSIATAVDQIWIVAYRDGHRVRELRYTSADGWFEDGAPLPFEDSRALGRWRRKRRLLASPDGYSVLDAFLGRRPAEPVVEPGATLRISCAPVHAAELRAIADRAGVAVSAVVEASWHLAKRALYDRFMARATKLGLDLTLLVDDTSPPPPCDALPAFVHEPVEVSTIDLTRYQATAIPHHLALSPRVVAELEHMKTMFDVSVYELLDRAYLLARPRLA